MTSATVISEFCNKPCSRAFSACIAFVASKSWPHQRQHTGSGIALLLHKTTIAKRVSHTIKRDNPLCWTKLDGRDARSRTEIRAILEYRTNRRNQLTNNKRCAVIVAHAFASLFNNSTARSKSYGLISTSSTNHKVLPGSFRLPRDQTIFKRGCSTQ